MPHEIQEPQTGRLGQLRATVNRIPAQARQSTADVVRLLGAVVARLRVPLLVLVLVPLIEGVALIAVSAVRGGADFPIACVLAVLGAIPSAWLAMRRRQLLASLQPPEEAGAEIYAVFSAPDLMTRIKSNLAEVAARGGRLRTVGGSLWKGVKLTNELRHRIGDSPRLAPFLPGRLRGLLFLGGWCLLSGVVLGGFLVIKVLATSVGIG